MKKKSVNTKLPQHIAIVMDGNGRWAKKRFLPAAAGHKAGVEAVRTILEACQNINIKNLTLFAFSSENWSRPALEVKALMQLFSSYLDNEIDELTEKNIRVRFIGRRDRFSSELLMKINHAEQQTIHCTKFNLTLAIDYGGQWDIVEAAKQLAIDVSSGKLTTAEITPELFDKHLCLAELPNPDLMIRTSGEYRISNFLLWQLAYAEFYFTDVLWPDFDKEELARAIKSFSQRDRRFGGRNEMDEQ